MSAHTVYRGPRGLPYFRVCKLLCKLHVSLKFTHNHNLTFHDFSTLKHQQRPWSSSAFAIPVMLLAIDFKHNL